MSERKKRSPSRLASRIRRLLVGLAVSLTAVFAMIGWMLLLTAEELIRNKYYEHLLEHVAQSGAEAPLPPGVTRYTSSESISEALGLADPPMERGLYSAFRDSSQHRTKVMYSYFDYMKLPEWSGWEEELVIWVDSPGQGETATWLVSSADEYTDAIVGWLQIALLIAALVVIVVALSASRLIAQWALKPVVALAERVQKRNPDTKADSLSPGRSERVDHDEVGFLEGALDAYEGRLRESLARERDFLADCSHELRTPVATLKGAVALLQSSADDSAKDRYFGRIERSVHRMERLIEIFLMVAREGHHRMPTQSVDAVEVVSEVVDEIRALYPTHPLRIRLFLDQTVTIVCHREVLAVLCHNLIGNAFTHLADGELCVRLDSVEGEARLRVEDDGPGLPEFKGVGEESASVPEPGHGYGLTLVERLCRTCGWRLIKAPRDQGGTRIEVNFPGARADKA
ncbi:HAMP domain-containing sensor histidine kinase [Pelagicoccus sp. SDUM812003]|uniref:sensor histidine kinase n=1 Tax=Pelagicoccus sp. SDUM812003 TaxID=3041267 RepID=UPI00280C6B59|nr:HAMP domain-containing sensor histidine kinase [Pelagicoccus sp. SDUM812003]MDQ8203479.1 HAMP domain-containing sensor histidine kinase [Pelagicoccus sp. SDUM812003]